MLAAGCAPREDGLSGELERVARALGLGIETLEVVASVDPTSAEAPYRWALKVAEAGTDRIWRVTGPFEPLTERPPPGGVCDRPYGVDPRWLLIRYRPVHGEAFDHRPPPGSTPAEAERWVRRRHRELGARTLARHGAIPGFTGARRDAYGPFVVDQIETRFLAAFCRRGDLLFVGPYGEPQRLDNVEPQRLANVEPQRLANVEPQRLANVEPQRLANAEPGGSPTIRESLARTLTDRVQARGVFGRGVRVAVIEPGQPDMPLACYEMATDCCPAPSYRDPAADCRALTRACCELAPGGAASCVQDCQGAADGHLSDVMAILGSDLPPASGGGSECRREQRSGYAPGAPLLVASAAAPIARSEDVSDWLCASSWASSRGARVLTMSFHPRYEELEGTLGSRDVFFDWLVVHERVSVFTSAGNQGHLERRAYASGKGYNFLGVANVQNVAGVDRCDTVIAGDSTWRNPSTWHRDRELPEVAMPGSSYEILGRSFGGTSAATPAAAGVAALLMEARPDLRRQPEAIRALLLAGAGYQLADRWDWRPTQSCDGKDGAGLVDAWQAHSAAVAGGGPGPHGHHFGRLRAGSFRPAGDEPPHGYRGPLGIAKRRLLDRVWFIEARRGERVRAVVTWNSDVDSAEGPSVLDLDLDLVVVAPDGSRRVASATFDNSYELAVFAAPEAGTYRLEAMAYDVPDDLDTFYGVAWTTTSQICGKEAVACGD